MFEAAELRRKVSKAAFDEAAPGLRLDLIRLQQQLRGAGFPAIVLFSGLDGAGKGEALNLLNEWMDPRWIATNAYGPPTQEEAERPEFWRYWRDLPPRSTIGLFLGGWFHSPLVDRAYGRIGTAKLEARLERITAFERMLTDNGALILKFWLHLDRKSQEKRLRRLEKEPYHHKRITKQDWRNWKRHDRFVEAGSHIITRTSTAAAPWTIIDGWDPRNRSLTILTTVRDALDAQLGQRGEAAREARRRRGTDDPPAERFTPSVLSSLDLSKSVRPSAYPSALQKARTRLHEAGARAHARRISAMLVFEGWDAAGKGGSIRRLVAALDARDYRVHSFAAPSDEELAQHYLWRFWRRVPRAGRIAIFDRSWYGRLLVERVEGLATENEWQRAYGEINAFEAELIRHGIVLVKYWLHIDADEQERRFVQRRNTPHKRWKLTDEDWRNRDKRTAYETAVAEMIERTGTPDAPWTLVEANDKKHARIEIIRAFCEALESRLN